MSSYARPVLCWRAWSTVEIAKHIATSSANAPNPSATPTAAGSPPRSRARVQARPRGRSGRRYRPVSALAHDAEIGALVDSLKKSIEVLLGLTLQLIPNPAISLWSCGMQPA